MSDDTALHDAKRVIAETLATDFNDVKILEVKVEKDLDSEGDDILRVEVIFEGSRKNLDPKKMSGAVRHVRPKLSAIGELAFPLFSFISQKETDAGRLATA